MDSEAWQAGGGAQSVNRAVSLVGTGGTLDVASGVLGITLRTGAVSSVATGVANASVSNTSQAIDTLALAPKLRDVASSQSFSPDWGATNHASRALVVVGAQPADKLSLQGFAFSEQGKGAQLGLNANALLGDATVAYAEWAGGKDHDLLSAALGMPRTKTAHRAAAGLTFTTPGKLSLTGELQYDGFALDKAGWNDALRVYGLEPLGAYLVEVQRRQDIASRKAAMVYVSQRDAGVKGLELTGLVRVNLEDHSRFWWAEARYHFNRVDLAVQWQQNQGRADTEFGAMPARTLLQVVLAAYF